MTLTISAITLVDLTKKEAKKVKFSPGKNFITSAKNHQGKSVIMKSIYYTLGAEVYFPTPIKNINLMTYVDFQIDRNSYRVARLGRIFLVYINGEFYKSFSSVGRFGDYISELFNFEIDLVGKDQEGTITKCPPVFYYLPYYIDQEYGWSGNSNSFNNITQFDLPQRKNSYYFHLGVFDSDYVECLKKDKANSRRIKALEKENEKLLTVISTLQSGMDSTHLSFDIESLERAISQRQQTMQTLLKEITKIRQELITAEDQIIEINHTKDILSKYIKGKKTTDEGTIKDELTCPRCGMVFEYSLTQKMEKAYLIESLHDDYTKLSNQQIAIERRLSTLKAKFSEKQDRISEYEKQLSIDQGTYNEYIKSKATNQILKDYHSLLGKNNSEIEMLRKEHLDLNQQLTLYKEEKTKANDDYTKNVGLLFAGLDIPPEQINDDIEPGSTLSLSGAYGPRCKIAQMLAFIEMQQSISESIISFPLIIDSPNSLEQDSEHLDSVIQTLLTWEKSDNQIIVASLEGADIAAKIPGVRIITLTNPKNHLLNKQEYEELESEISNIFTTF